MNKPGSPGGNEFEWRVRSELTKRGMRFQVERKDLTGTPDIVFPEDKLVVFLDGCFWHGCRFHRGVPKRIDYWTDIWNRAALRDDEVSTSLRNAGWTVLRFWEHEPAPEIADQIQTIRSFRNRAHHR